MTKSNFYFISADEHSKISCVKYVPDGKPKAILQISHGMMEMISRYDDFAKYLCENGILVAGNDHIGHGESVASKDDFGYWDCKDAGAVIVSDLHKITTIIKKDYPDIPYFVLGHSMGSFMIRRYLTKYSHEINGAIVMGTGNQSDLLVATGQVLAGTIAKIRGDRYRSELVRSIAFAGYDSRIPKEPDAGNWQTRDMEILKDIMNRPECTFTFTASAYKHMFDTIRYVTNKKNIAKVRKDLPIMVISGAEDPVGEYGKGVLKAYKAYKERGIEDLVINLIPDMRHEVLNEIGRDEVYRYILDWIEERI